MSMTYANAETEARAHSRSEPAAFVPRYARPTKSKKAVKTWMILAPIGAVVLLGSAAAMMMRGEEGRAPVQSVETVTPETEAATAALSAVAFITKKDFSFLGPILTIGGFIALGVIVCSILFGFNLGTIFSGVMILFAAGSVLYSTSNILHQYRVDQHVAASLSLFASVALLFWYVLRLLMSLNRN